VQTVQTRSTDIMQMFFTSGTTGPPKMTQLSCASYGLGHAITAKYWMDLCPTDVHWNLADPGWAKSAYSNVFGPWINGACVFIHSMPRVDPPLVLQVSTHASDTTFSHTVLYHSTSKSRGCSLHCSQSMYLANCATEHRSNNNTAV